MWFSFFIVIRSTLFFLVKIFLRIRFVRGKFTYANYRAALSSLDNILFSIVDSCTRINGFAILAVKPYCNGLVITASSA